MLHKYKRHCTCRYSTYYSRGRFKKSYNSLFSPWELGRPLSEETVWEKCVWGETEPFFPREECWIIDSKVKESFRKRWLLRAGRAAVLWLRLCKVVELVYVEFLAKALCVVSLCNLRERALYCTVNRQWIISQFHLSKGELSTFMSHCSVSAAQHSNFQLPIIVHVPTCVYSIRRLQSLLLYFVLAREPPPLRGRHGQPLHVALRDWLTALPQDHPHHQPPGQEPELAKWVSGVIPIILGTYYVGRKWLTLVKLPKINYLPYSFAKGALFLRT